MKSSNESKINKNKIGVIAYFIALGVSIFLAVYGFFAPPVGEIDGSVITVIGIFMIFALIGKIDAIIEAGKSVKIQSGNTSVQVNADE